MRVFRKKSTAVVAKQTPRGKTEVCEKELAAVCVLSAAGTSAYADLQVWSDGRYPDRL